jgi:hypothetical protein
MIGRCGALGSSHCTRVHGALIAPTHHTLASSASSKANGYTPPVDAMRIDLRCHASRGGQCASGALLVGLGDRLLAEKGQVGYVTRMCPFRPRSSSRHMQHISGQYWKTVCVCFFTLITALYLCVAHVWCTGRYACVCCPS